MAIGPYPGNGHSWPRGHWTIGIWNEPDQQGFGEPAGHLLASGDWQIDATLAQDTPSGWQFNINQRTKGLLGAYIMEALVSKANTLIPQLYPINSHPQPVQNDEPYALDTINAAYSQYLDSTPDGLLKQKGT